MANAAQASIGAIVLAAGASSRMGAPKQLLPIDGVPLLARTVEVLLATPVWPVVVVLGANADAMRPLLARAGRSEGADPSLQSLYRCRCRARSRMKLLPREVGFITAALALIAVVYREHKLTIGQISKIIGKSRSHIANTLRLLKLPESVRQMLKDGLLSAGHARALLTMENAESVAKRIVAEGLSVRDVEKLAAEPTKPSGPLSKKSADALKPKAPKDADTRALEKALNDVLGMNVEISHHGEAGSMTIHYSSLEQLDALCQKLKL